MPRRLGLVILASMICAFCALCARPSGEVSWRGRIEKVDGITTVFNPNDPLYGPGALRLEEELSLAGEPGGPGHELGRPWYIAVSDAGEIFVMDQAEACVQVFSRTGAVVRRIGRKGQGPGELQNPNSIYVTADGSLFFEDFYRGLNVFGPDGNFREFIPTAGFVDILVTSKGRIVARVNTIEGDQPGKQIRVFDGRIPSPALFPFRADEPRDPQVIKPFAGTFCWTLAGDEALAVSYEGRYDIEILSLNGTPLRRIKKDYEPVKIGDEEIARLERVRRGRKMEIPPAHAAVRGLWADEEGRLIVMTYERSGDGISINYDLFDRDGRCLVKLPIPEEIRPQVWKGGRLYALAEDPDGNSRVVVFRLVWQAGLEAARPKR